MGYLTMYSDISFKADRTKGLEVYADTDSAGCWSIADSENTDCTISRTGFVIYYANCLVIWCSKLQTEIEFSTADAKYITMSHDPRAA